MTRILYFDDWPVSVASVAYLYSKKVRRSWFHIDTMTHTLVDTITGGKKAILLFGTMTMYDRSKGGGQ